MAASVPEVPMHKNAKTTLPRIKNFYTDERFRETNLVGKIYPQKSSVSLAHWALPGGEGAWMNYTFQDVVKQEFTPVELGSSYGPTWSTHWFKVDFTIPAEWKNKEVHLRWDSNSEAALWNTNGQIIVGFSNNQRRSDYVLYKNFNANGTDEATHTFYVEMAVSKMFGAPEDDQLISPVDENVYLTLKMAEIAVQDSLVYSLLNDLDVLYQIASELKDQERGIQAMNVANRMINYILLGEQQTARVLAENFFSDTNGTAVHIIHAIGNCHIDSAWLWPYSEARRKVARSYSSQLALSAEYSPFSFVGSQAAHWAWLKETYPELFERLKHGPIIPVGTAWCEMDGNMPSGESFIRQLYFGNKFYTQVLGYKCREFWLPDTFGYSAQIPAMMKHCGLDRFLSQKLSWSMVNKFPNSSFIWEGIDGSRVLAHFPPGDTYSAQMKIDEVLRTVNNNKDKGRVTTTAMLFGHGDGGGGPNRQMYERRHRLDNVDGIPRVKISSPNELFTELEKQTDNMMKWVGELFLELHNGTYTSQAYMKYYNRISEFRLRDSEFMLTLSLMAGKEASLKKEMTYLEHAWKNVLLNQFHDVLPGSGIEIVYPDAIKLFKESLALADAVYNKSIKSLGSTADEVIRAAVNTLQWPRTEVVNLSAISDSPDYRFLKVPAFGFSELTSTSPSVNVTVASNADGSFTMENSYLTAVITKCGQIKSLKVKGNERELFNPSLTSSVGFGNQITIYDDEPLYWDAWDIMDYHLETATVLNDNKTKSKVTYAKMIENTPEVGRIRWEMKISEKSTIEQDIVLYADCPYLKFETTVDWKENHKVLKTVFEPDLLIREANFDIQFGYLTRPTHMNTSWDTARYEVCGHKWADISEPSFGMAILNDSKYGWCARGRSLSLTMLKAPKAPDFNCDMRVHNFNYAIMPHSGTLRKAEVMRRGYEFNNPLRISEIGKSAIKPSGSPELFSVEGDGIILHTIKPADDSSGDILLRVFESNGCRSYANIYVPKVVNVHECDGHEVAHGKKLDVTHKDNTTVIPVALRPFNIAAFRLSKPATVSTNSSMLPTYLSFS